VLHWAEFSVQAPAIAAAGVRLLQREEVAFLATAEPTGRPRLHPFVPRIVDGALVAFIGSSTPKIKDLQGSGYYALHTAIGAEDEEFFISGRALHRNDEADLRAAADIAMAFATGSADDTHILFEFLIDRALWTTWENFGTPEHRPNYRRWRSARS
jgi:hypothetical protein